MILLILNENFEMNSYWFVYSTGKLDDVFTGLQENGLLDTYSHILTGYIGKDSFLTEVGTIVKAIREVNPNTVYGKRFRLERCVYGFYEWEINSTNFDWFAVCDPVLGDNGHLYVPENLIPIYQNEILPLSDICTPNQFEAEILSGKKIKSHEDAWAAIDWFHEKGVKTVVLSSTNFAPNSELIAFLSQQNGNYYLSFLQYP